MSSSGSGGAEGPKRDAATQAVPPPSVKPRSETPREVGLAHTIASTGELPEGVLASAGVASAGVAAAAEPAGPAPGPTPRPTTATITTSDPGTPYSISVIPGVATTELTPGTLVGEYRVEGKLGEGGMGQVFAAVHPLIGKRAAIKVIKLELCANPEAVERFVQEARAVNQIGHPNIVDVFSFGTLPDGRRYLVMEWLKGESLSARLKRERLTVEECCEILEPVCRALEAAHDKRIIHRDLKPDNVFLVSVKGEKPIVKLLDFGIAKLVGTDDTRLERTRTGSMLGTPAYISPEQARGRGVDERTDIYALGAMAFEMFTGRALFVADTAMDMISCHLHDPPPVPSSVERALPAALDTLLLGMVEKDAGKRPALERVRRALAEIRKLPAATRQTVRSEPPRVDALAMTSMAPPAAPPAAAVRTDIEGELRAPATGAGRPRRGGLWLGVGVAALAVGGAVVALRGGGDHAGAGAAGAAVAGAAGAGAAVAPDAGASAAVAPVEAVADAAPVAAVGAPDAAVAVAPATGRLALEVYPAEATVLVDDQPVAVSGGRVAVELPAGRHVVVVQAPGRQSETRTVVIPAGGAASGKVRLERGGDKPGPGKPGAKDPNAATKDPNAATKDPNAATKDPNAATKDPKDKPPGDKPPGDDDTVW